MRFLSRCALTLMALASVPLHASAQANATLPTQQSVYSTYVTRHEATVKFAELGTTDASSKDVRKLAEQLVKEHKETGEKITKLAAEQGITLSRPAHDTTEAMLANATQLLKDKSATERDSIFAVQAYGWLSTLVLDNNKNVLRPLPDGDLKKFGQAYGTFLFRELVEVGKLKNQYQKK